MKSPARVPFRITACLLGAALLGCDEREAAPAPAERPPPAATAPADAPEAARAPAPPEDTGPPKRIFAKRFIVNVRAEPRTKAPAIGYLRAGAVLRAKTSRPVGDEECRGGWYELTTGGFVCNRRDVLAYDGDRLPERRSVQADREALLPYEYGSVIPERTPMYRRLPNDAEAMEHEGWRPPAPEGEPGTDVPPPDGETPPAQPAEVAPPPAPVEPAPAGEPALVEQEEELAPTLASLEGGGDGVVLRFLMRGFHVSLDTTMRTGSRRYWRTQHNGFVPIRSIRRVRGSRFDGVVLDGTSYDLPVGFVLSKRAPAFERREDGRIVARRGGGAEYHDFFRIASEETAGRTSYYATPDGTLYRASDVTRIARIDRPAEVPEGAKWIDIDLSLQTLVAYEGDRPVFATLVSTGRRSRDSDPEQWETPTGVYRVRSKHLTTSMEGDSAMEGPYSLDDVPYVMYFHESYAIHSAYWHNLFGHPKSHGCVNMSPHDARWLWLWADPQVPEGWHGAYPGEEGGTIIVIRGETPRWRR